MTPTDPADRNPSPAASVLALTGFVTLFALLCAPWLEKSQWMVPEPGDAAHPDTQLVVWVLWWVSSALRYAPTSLFDAPLNYPLPHQLTGSDHFLSSQILFSPFYGILGNPIQATTLTVWLATFPLTAWAMHRMLTRLGLSPWACLAGAFLYTLSPEQVPFDIHRLQTPLVFFPLVTSSVLSLRSSPSWRRTAVLAIVLSIGLLSSFYLAAMLVIVAAILILVPDASSGSMPRRFLSRGLLALGVGITVLACVSIPYFGRGEVWATADASADPAAIPRALGHFMRDHPMVLFGGWLPLGLAIIGLQATRDLRTRGIAIAATLIAIAGVILATGGLALLADVPAPPIAQQLISLPARFFRVSTRLVSMVTFGISVLASLGIDNLAHRSPRVTRAAAIALVVGLLATRGLTLRDTKMARMIEQRSETLAYAEVGRIAGQRGPGPLLELPTINGGTNWQADHMIGSIWHGQPIVTGRTGYNPPENQKVVELAGELPSESALEQLVALTGLRWVLVRPRPGFKPRDRNDLVWQLAKSPLVEEGFNVGKWALFRLRDKSRD